MNGYSDNLTFNTEQLQSQIGILEQVRDTIQVSKNNYIDYIIIDYLSSYYGYSN